jgi:hypothetical protein
MRRINIIFSQWITSGWPACLVKLHIHVKFSQLVDGTSLYVASLLTSCNKLVILSDSVKSSPKSRKWRFRDSKFKNFLGPSLSAPPIKKGFLRPWTSLQVRQQAVTSLFQQVGNKQCEHPVDKLLNSIAEAKIAESLSSFKSILKQRMSWNLLVCNRAAKITCIFLFVIFCISCI